MAAFNETGSVKNAWLEYISQPILVAEEGLRAEPTVNNVRVQNPTPPEESPPVDGGKPEDVWIYGDGDGNVLGIPKRGTWHPNRVSPGWPELVGVYYKTAIDTIVSEAIGVRVIYGPEGFPRILDFDITRVWLDVDKDGNVALVPRLG